VIGEGKKAKLWEDKWIGEESLCHKFPRLYSISECKEKSAIRGRTLGKEWMDLGSNLEETKTIMGDSVKGTTP